MKVINLFIASSATSELLNKQKEALAKKCKELNTEFAEGNIDYYIKPIAYEDLERRMEVFENHVENDDIVVFLVDGTKDPNLEEKLKVAAEKYRAGSKPELLVFVSTKIDEEYEQKIKGILKAKGWLYENLDSHDDDVFLTNVENRIKGYIAQYDERRKQRTKWYIALIIIFFIVGAMLYLLFVNLNLNRQLETKRLLIVGGGSARCFIEEALLKQKNGLSTEYWLYAPMPSGDAYRMMAEDIINNKDFNKHPYFPIVVSAGRANEDSVFRRTIEKERFIKHGVVVGVYLGNDYLVVYRGNEALRDVVKFEDSTIKMTILDSLIKNQIPLLLKGKDSLNTIIYTTNKNSGTLNSYRNAGCNSLDAYIGLCDSLKRGYIFSGIDSLSSLTSQKWIAFGSKFYRTLDDTTKLSPLTVLDNNDKIIPKPVYVYFMLYKDKDDQYKLPNATEKFLNKIGVDSIKKILSVRDSIDTINKRILYDNFELETLKKIISHE